MPPLDHRGLSAYGRSETNRRSGSTTVSEVTTIQAATWTAIGTLALAGATLAAIITTIIITAQDRRRADRRLAAEQHDAQEREQLAEAYLVQVLQGERDTGPPTDPVYEEPSGSVERLGAIVINRGRYTIIGVEARLRFANRNVVPFRGSERVTSTKDLDKRLSNGMTGLLEALSHSDRLTPWDVGLRFWSDPTSTRFTPGWYPIIRWTDRWGKRWEHQRGEVHQVRDGEPWGAELPEAPDVPRRSHWWRTSRGGR